MRPTVKLGEICDILDKKRKPITQKDRTKGIYPYYGASGILDYVADYIFDEDLVLIGEDGAKRGALDNSAFKVSGKVWVNNHAHVIRPHREKILDDFLVYFLVSSDLSDYITGTTVPKLNQERLKLIEIPLPPLETQKAIVAKLDQIFVELDQTKSEIQKNLDNTDELRKSALNQAFQGDWEMKKLGEIVRILNGRAYSQNELLSKGKYPVLRVGNFFTNSNWYYSDLELEEDKYCNNGDLLYAWSASFGPKIWEGGKTIYHYHIWKMELSDKIDKHYLYHYLYRDSENIKRNGHGVAMMHITKGDMEKKEIPVPPLSEQEKIVKHLDQVFKEVKALKSQYQSQLDNLEELKKSVLDKAFRGEMG